MWLTTNAERDALAYYYAKIKKPNDWYEFPIFSNGSCSIDEIDDETTKLLEERGLIKVKDLRMDGIRIKLTMQGFDLGHKYHNPIIRSGLWFAEYKYHWFWLIVAYFAGILSAIIVNRFS